MIKAGIIGATGYAGVELLRLLLSHPNVEVAAISSVSFEGKPISEIYPSLYQIDDMTLGNQEDVIAKCDVVFASLPHGLSEEMGKKCFDAGKVFIDLGADFRLDSADVYTKWYNKEYN
ncbi:MAG: N-acetyl-gamma-glutamyl-phosphate reductase, partial [Clostridia bacterium]|nr:N-acetyl-gamma-glutamyl-phosphate reductase [Clostridia bacterium]